MKNKIYLVSMVLVMVGLLIIGCATPAPATKPTPTPAPTPTPSPAQVFELRFSSPWPENGPNHQRQYKPILDEIVQKSNGRIKFATFLAGALGKNQEQYDIARTGKADMVTISTGYTPNRFPLSEILTLPLVFPSTYEAQDAVIAIGDRIIYKEFSDTHLLAPYQSQVFYLYTNKKVEKLEDMKGLKIRSAGGLNTKTIELLGGVPVTMGLPDVYLSMQTGVMDAGILGPSGLLSFKLQEVTKHELKLNLGHTLQILTMNNDTWNKLPKDLQQIATDAAKKAGRYEADLFMADAAPVAKMLTERGGTSTALSPEEEARWVKALTPVFTDYIAELKSKGLAVDELVTIIREEAKKRNVPFPY